MNVKLSSPWVTYYRELNALFEADPDVEIKIKEEECKIGVFVTEADKAAAIEKILPSEKSFGNVTFHIFVIAANKEETTLDLFKKAFAGNPAFSYAVSVGGIYTNPMNYVVFRNKVVQFWNDNIGDINGNQSMLFEDCARNVFNMNNIQYCTDEPENLGIFNNECQRSRKTVEEIFKVDD